MKTHTWFAHVLKSTLFLALMALAISMAFSAPLPVDAATKNTSGNALNFDGTDDYILTGLDPSTTLDQTFAIEAWVNPRSAGNYRGIGGDHGSVGGIVFGQYNTSDGGWAFGGFDTANTAVTPVIIPVIPLNQWSHVAAVYVGGVSGSITVYLNGVQAGQSTWSNRSFGHTTTFYIGQALNGAGRRFDGQIDEFRVWSTARTATEIRQNMFRELSLTPLSQAIVYHLNQSSGTTAYDSSSNGRDGTLTNFTGTPWRTSGAFAGPRNALDFDGTNDYVLTGLDPSATLGQSFTIETWVNPRSAGNYRGIGGDHDGTLGIVFGQYSTGGVWDFGAYDTANSGLPSAAIPVIPLNQWSHVAAVYVGGVSGSITVYLNGVQVGQSTWSNRSFGHKTTFYIGQALNGADRRFDGQIDEFRIWNTARTVAQISDDMAHQLVGNESGLQAYYRFDEGTASGTNTITTLDDLTSNNRHGTLNNFALTGATSNWVASSAFNTWLGAESTDWATIGNWSRNAAPVAADNVGIYTYGAPTNAPTLGSAATVNHLAVVSPLTANANLTVNGNLILDADLTASGSNIVILGASSNVVGANDVIGTVRRTSPGTGSALQFNNQYTTFNFSTAPSQMDVKLIKSTPSGFTKAVSRYYTLTPTGSVNATIQLAYQSGEIGTTTEANEKLWRYDTGQSKWVLQGGTVNTTNHFVSLAGVTQFSDWAITDTGAPTAVTLSTFNATSDDPGLGMLIAALCAGTLTLGWFALKMQKR